MSSFEHDLPTVMALRTSDAEVAIRELALALGLVALFACFHLSRIGQRYSSDFRLDTAAEVELGIVDQLLRWETLAPGSKRMYSWSFASFPRWHPRGRASVPLLIIHGHAGHHGRSLMFIGWACPSGRST